MSVDEETWTLAGATGKPSALVGLLAALDAQKGRDPSLRLAKEAARSSPKRRQAAARRAAWKAYSEATSRPPAGVSKRGRRDRRRSSASRSRKVDEERQAAVDDVSHAIGGKVGEMSSIMVRDDADGDDDYSLDQYMAELKRVKKLSRQRQLAKLRRERAYVAAEAKKDVRHDPRQKWDKGIPSGRLFDESLQLNESAPMLSPRAKELLLAPDRVHERRAWHPAKRTELFSKARPLSALPDSHYARVKRNWQAEGGRVRSETMRHSAAVRRRIQSASSQRRAMRARERASEAERMAEEGKRAVSASYKRGRGGSSRRSRPASAPAGRRKQLFSEVAPLSKGDRPLTAKERQRLIAPARVFDRSLWLPASSGDSVSTRARPQRRQGRRRDPKTGKLIGTASVRRRPASAVLTRRR
eukprot:PLAT6545.1.p1 GENE.PLAT6545.1~~PLAT6545.1.p1  ORF type:complete len:414 (-),score=69.89 PLAT6545.1:77-1318(-)